MSEAAILQEAGVRANETHIFFWPGVLSNWHEGAKFSGHRCFDLLLPKLTELEIEHPPMSCFTTRLIADHHYKCGEQWMMAMKAWLFERDIELGEWIAGDEAEFQRLKTIMYEARVPEERMVGSKERAMWESTVCQVLRAKKPREQKALGRQARGFVENVWTAACIPVVVAACIARAEADALLKKVYLNSGKREFVEGSPKDTIWGVGLHWKGTQIERPSLWIGENRLGRCHDQAAAAIREMFNRV